MITGTITAQGFGYLVREVDGVKLNAAGKPTGEKQPLKVLILAIHNTALEIHLPMSPEQFEKFTGDLTGRTIITAPAGAFKLGEFKRNGQPR